MTLPGGPPSQPQDRGRVFRYDSWTADAETGTLTCRYSLDGREFAERITLLPGPQWHTDEARAAARLVFLLAGVSYYKTAAPPVIDLGPTALTETELATLREFYLQGLGEFAYRNILDLGSLRIEAPRAAPQASTPAQHHRQPSAATRRHLPPAHPLRRRHRLDRHRRARPPQTATIAPPPCSSSAAPRTVTPPSRSPPRSPGCPSSGPGARSIRSFSAPPSWAS